MACNFLSAHLCCVVYNASALFFSLSFSPPITLFWSICRKTRASCCCKGVIQVDCYAVRVNSRFSTKPVALSGGCNSVRHWSKMRKHGGRGVAEEEREARGVYTYVSRDWPHGQAKFGGGLIETSFHPGHWCRRRRPFNTRKPRPS